MSVSGNRPVPTDRRKTIVDRRPRKVGIAIISEPHPGSLACSCNGFATMHRRQSVRETQAQRHLDKKHDGQGVWL